MTIQQQIATLIILVMFSTPIIITYFFYPRQNIFNTKKIDIETTILFGIATSLVFFSSIMGFMILIKEFPLLGIPLLGFLSYKLYENWEKIYNTAIDNYKYYHMKE